MIINQKDMVKQLKKKQEIICLDRISQVNYSALALRELYAGRVVKLRLLRAGKTRFSLPRSPASSDAGFSCLDKPLAATINLLELS